MKLGYVALLGALGYLLVVALGLSLLQGASYGAAYGEWGVGFQHPASDQVSDKLKFVEFGYIRPYKTFDTAVAIGGWTDVTGYAGTKNSAYVKYMLGLETRKTGFYMGYWLGPAFITNPDILLGSHFELAHSFEFGWIDSRGVSIGMTIQHYSDAGLCAHNFGRNFIGPKARF